MYNMSLSIKKRIIYNFQQSLWSVKITLQKDLSFEGKTKTPRVWVVWQACQAFQLLSSAVS